MRNISDKIFIDEFFGRLSPVHRILWIGMIAAIADDQGRMEDNVTLMRSRLFPYDKDITDKDIDKGLAAFEGKHKITRYQAGTNGSGKKLIQINNWWTYQYPQWARESIFPAPRNWVDRVRCHKEGYGQQEYRLNWDKPGGFVLASKRLPSRKQAASKPLPSREEEKENKDLKNLSSLSSEAADFFSKKTGTIDASQANELSTLLSGGIPSAWIDDAIAIATSKNKHSTHYVIAILKNWKQDGRHEDKLSKAKGTARAGTRRTANTSTGKQPSERKVDPKIADEINRRLNLSGKSAT
jgi:DnaD/phage-associated family protein